MSLPFPSKVFTPFDQLPASDLNEMVANDEYLETKVIQPAQYSNPYKFRVYRNLIQYMNGIGSNTKIAFDTESYDTNSNFDSTTDFRYIAPVTGYYSFTARTLLTSVGVNGQFQLWKNGALISRGTNVIGDYPGIIVSDTIKLDANDFVEVYFYNGAANNPALQFGDVASTYFTGHLVSLT